jgi:hypothetical protein
MDDYKPVYPFLGYQEIDFERFRYEKVMPNLYEQGLGKSKVSLDIAADKFLRGEIDFLLVIAQRGVHSNWARFEAPKHLPEQCKAQIAEWSSQMRAAQRDACRALFENHEDRSYLRVLAMNAEAFGVPVKHYKQKAAKIAGTVLDNFRVMLVVDEFSFACRGGSRARRLTHLGKKAVVRHGLDGTPIAKAPLDLWQPFEMMRGDGEPLLGPHSANRASFDARYADWRNQTITRMVNGTEKTHTFRQAWRYKNLDELGGHIDACGIRRTKSQELDLPPKVYQTLRVEMSPKQQQVYKDAKKLGFILDCDGEMVETDKPSLRELRQQQILGGMLPHSIKSRRATPIEPPEKIPRVQAVLDTVDKVQTGKVLIFCAFVPEVHMLAEVLGNKAVTYMGAQNYEDPEEREENKERFLHDDAVQVLIGTSAIARGHTLTVANTIIFYSHWPNYDIRMQAEDRAHRIGTNNSVLYVDIVTPNSIDTKRLEAVGRTFDLAAEVLRDEGRTWR